MDLSDRVAVVTGGASGIGRATCLALADHGADVVVADVRAEPRESGEVGPAEREPTHELVPERTGRRARYVDCDVTDRTDLEAAVDAAEDLGTGTFDCMVNDAGVFRELDFRDVTVEAYESLMATNAEGTFFGAQVAAERMDEGAIVNVSSIASLHGTGDHPVYSASKAAVSNMTRSMADALGPEIRVNAVLPGVIDTAMTRKDVPTLGADRAARYSGEIPAGRFGAPGDVADAVVYLASDMADYITGECLVVDGGLSAT